MNADISRRIIFIYSLTTQYNSILMKFMENPVSEVRHIKSNLLSATSSVKMVERRNSELSINPRKLKIQTYTTT